MKQTVDNVILPCPFCGGDADLSEIEAHTHGPLAKFMPDHPGSWAVECHNGCGVGVLREDRAEALTAWNRRAEAAEITRLTAIITQQQADLRTLAGAVQPIGFHRSHMHLKVFYALDPTRDAEIAAAVGRALAV